MQNNNIPSTLLENADHTLKEWSELSAQFKWSAEVMETVQAVFVSSEYVARLCLRFPEILYDLQETGYLFQSYEAGKITAILTERLHSISNEADLVKHLRQFRQREMIRIIWRDLAGWADLVETMRDLSELADTCVELALEHIYKWCCEEYGTPKDENGVAQHLVVLGMGKLGGHELNLSSDIDLIFAYPEEGQTLG
ncbi:MAG: bifunctional glutamine synthetase adenylyltransferase/deadenyltransferase, partial [Thioalkalispiraceae bacterium]